MLIRPSGSCWTLPEWCARSTVGAARHSRTAAAQERCLGVWRKRVHQLWDSVKRASCFASIVTLYEAARAEFVSRPEDALRRFEEAGRTARASLTEARRVVWALRPGPLEDGTLASALEELAAGFHSETGLDARLEFAARGRSNSEIAEELFVSATTAKAHLAHVYRKLGVGDRTAAVTTALERQIIRLDEA